MRGWIHFSVSYDRNVCEGIGGGHIVYDLAFSLTTNLVYKTLSDKRQRLKRLTDRHPRGIVLCDGGSNIMRSNWHSTGSSFSIEQIVTRFMRRRLDVDFVVTASVESPSTRPKGLHVKLYLNPGSARPLSDPAGDAMLDACRWIPPPLVDSANIRNMIERNPRGAIQPYPLGCETVDDKNTMKVRISSRVLLDYLAGKLRKDEFERRMGIRGARNIFKIALEHGKVISGLSLEKEIYRDDDWAVIELRVDDPAVSPFRKGTWWRRRMRQSKILRKLRAASLARTVGKARHKAE